MWQIPAAVPFTSPAPAGRLSAQLVLVPIGTVIAPPSPKVCGRPGLEAHARSYYARVSLSDAFVCARSRQAFVWRGSALCFLAGDGAVSAASQEPAALVCQHLPAIRQSVRKAGVLDLACGSGRNGLFLARHKIPLVFADINPEALARIDGELTATGLAGECWQVDLEAPGGQALAGREFDVILVFNYLHRPLIPGIRRSLAAGGLLLYETFTAPQAAVGRPSNPDFLLQPGELRSWFRDWEIVVQFEGSDTSPPRHFASLVARKPGGPSVLD